MKNRRKVLYSNRIVLLTGLVLALSTAGIGCSGGGGSSSNTGSGGGTIQLSGSVGTGYAAAPMKPGFFANLLRAIGIGTPAYALADPVVDEVIAIPMSRGSLSSRNMASAVTGAINADMTFSLTLANNQDWLLVLVNSAATGTNRFVGSLALNIGSGDGLLNLPATDAAFSAFDLGVVTRPVLTSNDAISSNTVTATDFNMTAGQLLTLAKTDELFKNAKNIVNNYDSGTGVYFSMRTDFHWGGVYSTLSTTFSDPAYTSKGIGYQYDTNSTSVTMNQICDHSVMLSFAPSEPVSDGTYTYDSINPITSASGSCTPILVSGVTHTQLTGGPVYAVDAYDGLSFGPYILLNAVPSRWDFFENGVLKAEFDMTAAHPPVTADGKPKGFLPSFRINLVAGTTQIDSVDVKWFYYDGATDSYIPLTQADLKLLKHFIQSLEVKFDVTYNGVRKTCEMYFDPTTTTNVKPSASNCPDTWYFNDPNHPDTNTGLMGFYETGGFGYFFDFFAPLP